LPYPPHLAFIVLFALPVKLKVLTLKLIYIW
jgi:hypothetical protein